MTLHYLWPRPSLRLLRKDIIKTNWNRGLRTGTPQPIDVYTLELTTVAGRYVSYSDASLDDVQRARKRLLTPPAPVRE